MTCTPEKHGPTLLPWHMSQLHFAMLQSSWLTLFVPGVVPIDLYVPRHTPLYLAGRESGRCPCFWYRARATAWNLSLPFD